MRDSFLLILLYLGCATTVLAVAAWLGRPLPTRPAAAMVLFPILFFFPAFTTRSTPAPVDHCAAIPPWNSIPHPIPRNSNLNDIARQALPWAEAARQAWREGHLPWRDRWNGCGTPLAANGQSAVYAPWSILSMLLPLSKALPYLGALKLFLALMGTWLWIRELGLSPRAAFLGSLLTGFSLSMTFWLFWQQSSVICLWPWSLFLIERLREIPERRSWWALVFVLTLWPLAGHIESAALGAAFLALWLLGRFATGDRSVARLTWRALGAGLAAIGLSAFTLLPQLLAILASNRRAIFAHPFWERLLTWKPHGPRWGAAILTTLWPRCLGDDIASPMLPGNPASYPELALGHIGIVGWCVVLLLLRPGQKRDARSWGLVAVLLCGLFTATLLWPFGELASLLPGLAQMFPIRFLTWLAVAGGGLAAFELDRLERDLGGSPGKARWLAAIAGVIAIGSLIVFRAFGAAHRIAGGAQSQLRALLAAEFLLLALAAWGLLASAGKIPLEMLSIGIAVLAGAELLYQGARFYRLGSPDLLYPPTPLIRFLQSRPPPFRVLGEGSNLYPNSNVFARLEEVRTHDPTERRDYIEFLDRTCGYRPDPFFKDIQDVNASALDFLNVRYLVSSPDRAAPGPKWVPVYRGRDGSVFENREALPRAFSPAKLVWVAAESGIGDWTPNAITQFGSQFDSIARVRDWRDRAYLLASNSRTEANAPLDVLEYEERSHQIRLRARTDGQRAVLVLSVVHDGGWSATNEEGRRLETTRANGPFLAILVPRGEHRIRIRYIEPGFRPGLLVSSLAALLLAVGAGLKRRSSRKNREPESQGARS